MRAGTSSTRSHSMPPFTWRRPRSRICAPAPAAASSSSAQRRRCTAARSNPIYASVKNAQRGMLKALAREWGPHGITVNAIAPAAETDATKLYFERNPQVRDQILSTIALRRLGDAQADIGGAIVALSSDQCASSPADIPVDGGAYRAVAIGAALTRTCAPWSRGLSAPAAARHSCPDSCQLQQTVSGSARVAFQHLQRRQRRNLVDAAIGPAGTRR